MQRKIVIAYGVAGCLLLVALLLSAFTTPQSGVSVRVLDKRLTIQDVRLFRGTNVNYWYLPPFGQLKYHGQRVLDSIGIVQPWKRYDPHQIRGAQGPALVIRGRLEGGDTTELFLVRDSHFDPYTRLPLGDGFGNRSSTFVWEYRLRFINDSYETLVIVSNGVFHVRQTGESKDLALIEIRWPMTTKRGKLVAAALLLALATACGFLVFSRDKAR